MNRLAVVVCEHVASRRFPAAVAVRDDPIDEADSGWQVLCDSGLPELEDNAKLWAVENLLALEPSLRDFLHLPSGTRLERTRNSGTWNVAGRV